MIWFSENPAWTITKEGRKIPRMRIVSTDDMMPLEKPSVVCLGYFDGVHLGHMALLNAAREISKNSGMLMCVHTFDRSPAQEIHPEKAFPLLTPIPEKEALLEAAGSDVLAISRFDERMRHRWPVGQHADTAR